MSEEGKESEYRLSPLSDSQQALQPCIQHRKTLKNVVDSHSRASVAQFRHIENTSVGPEDSSLSFLSLVLTSSPSDHPEYISCYVLSGAIATDDAEWNLREEGTKDEISEYSADETGVL